MKDPNRQLWNQQQKILRSVLFNSVEHQETISLLLNQHAMVHSSDLTQSELGSFEDELWAGLTEENFRRIPRNSKNSIAWHIWHCTRIEDIAMNLIVVQGSQILYSDNWLERMQVKVHDTGNAMDEASIQSLSQAIDLTELQAYRLAVATRTREIMKQLEPEQLKQKVEPARLEKVISEGAVVEEARWLIDYWGKRKIAGILLMPATRHNFVHLNKSLKIKDKKKSYDKT